MTKIKTGIETGFKYIKCITKVNNLLTLKVYLYSNNKIVVRKYKTVK